MTSKGAQAIIETLSLRVFDIQDARAKLADEERHVRARIKQLEKIRDAIVPDRIIALS
jgi:hypothetical protein